jgi:hypothetical protein
MMGTPGPLAINRFVYANTPFQDDRDFAAVSYVANVPNVILANPATGFRNIDDMLAAARARPGQLNWGSPGVGSTGHIALEMLKQQAKVDIVHVPYKGASQATADLLGGQIQLSGDNVPTALPYVKGGKLVALGVMGERELPALPGVAPVNAAVPGYSLDSWFVVVAPSDTENATLTFVEGVLHAIAFGSWSRGFVPARRAPSAVRRSLVIGRAGALYKSRGIERFCRTSASVAVARSVQGNAFGRCADCNAASGANGQAAQLHSPRRTALRRNSARWPNFPSDILNGRS